MIEVGFYFAEASQARDGDNRRRVSA